MVQLRNDNRKNATLKETIRSNGTTKTWYRGGLIVDLELDLKRC